MGITEYKPVRNTIDIVILAVDDLPSINDRKRPLKNIQVLLVKRDIEPFNGFWTLPGGFVDYEKTITQSVNEKLQQKTGLTEIYTEQLYTYGDDLHRDPRDRVISIGYIALVDKKMIKEEILDDATWFWVKEKRENNQVVSIELINSITNDTVRELGFDHIKIIIDAINRLANKIMYTDIGFNLVGKQFTIGELRIAYETIVGREIPGFRRIISPKIKPTGLSTYDTKDKPDLYRPSQLYTKI